MIPDRPITTSVYDNKAKHYVDVSIRFSFHSLDRFLERADPTADAKLIDAVRKVMKQIVNDYPFESGSYLLRPANIPIKVPLVVDVKNPKLMFVTVKTVLTKGMRCPDDKSVPNLTENILIKLPHLYETKTPKGIEYSSYDELTDDTNSQNNDFFIIRNVQDLDRKEVDLKVVYKGLTSNWASSKWQIEFLDIYTGNLITKQSFSNTEKLKDFLKLNNIPF